MKSSLFYGLVCAIALSFVMSLSADARAGSVEVHLSGSGPVTTSRFSPGSRTVTVRITNRNNLNVGWDLFDVRTGRPIANDTIKSRGQHVVRATTHSGRSYYLRLRCSEPPWNRTKCRATGRVSW
jgi:hypothetical protein